VIYPYRFWDETTPAMPVRGWRINSFPRSAQSAIRTPVRGKVARSRATTARLAVCCESAVAVYFHCGPNLPPDTGTTSSCVAERKFSRGSRTTAVAPTKKSQDVWLTAERVVLSYRTKCTSWKCCNQSFPAGHCLAFGGIFLELVTNRLVRGNSATRSAGNGWSRCGLKLPSWADEMFACISPDGRSWVLAGLDAITSLYLEMYLSVLSRY
jgi:hypothetical protein